MTKENKGITLVALVTTIVIILILVAVTIMIAFDENGLITRAKRATEGWNEKQEEEWSYLNEFSDLNRIEEELGKIPEIKENEITERIKLFRSRCRSNRNSVVGLRK